LRSNINDGETLNLVRGVVDVRERPRTKEINLDDFPQITFKVGFRKKTIFLC
jgi:hypothetical protein